MKDVISVDSPVIALLHKCDHEPDEITKYVVIDQSEFVPQLHSLLISKLPEKMVRSEVFEGESDGTIEAYNSAITEMYSTLNELFGVSNE